MKADIKAKVIAAAKVADLEILIVGEAVYAEQDVEKEKKFSKILEKNGGDIHRTHLGSPFLPSFGKVTGNDVVFPWKEEKEPEQPKAKVAKSKAKTEGMSAFSDGQAITKQKRGSKKQVVQSGPGLFELQGEDYA